MIFKHKGTKNTKPGVFILNILLSTLVSSCFIFMLRGPHG